MEISIFATKCRHCGEAVGRPRDEARKLTIHDLGGTNATDYAPSEEVVDALESFRQEELDKLKEEAAEEGGTWFKRKKKNESAAKRGSSYGQLDPRSRDLASIKTFNTPRHHKRRQEPVWTGKLIFGASFVAAIVLLYLGGGFVKARIDDYIAKKNFKPEVKIENRAVAIMAKNGPPLHALLAAVEAVNAANTPDNQQIAEKARQAVKDKVNTLLNADPWSETKLDEASEIVTKAVAIDPGSETTKMLQDEVSRERADYKINLLRVDPALGEARLRVSMPDNRTEEIVARKGGTAVHGRFEVKNITSRYVRFEDPMRKSKSGVPREFILSLDGTISQP
jgi:hypothetical protein